MASKLSVLAQCTSAKWLASKIYFCKPSHTSSGTRYSSQQCHGVSSRATAILTAKTIAILFSRAKHRLVLWLLLTLLCRRAAAHPKQTLTCLWWPTPGPHLKAACGPTTWAKNCSLSTQNGTCQAPLSQESWPFTCYVSGSEHKLSECTLFLSHTGSDILGYNWGYVLQDPNGSIWSPKNGSG